MAKMTQKAIIVGLGNPGKEYENTYHNVGFLALDSLIKTGLKNYKKLFDFAETEDAIFIKPLTFMNESGKAIKEALKKFNVKPENLIVIHDDSDIVIGKYKISFSRNSAGHKGVQSIIDALKTKAFTRVRIGIRPTNETKRKKAGEFALKQITAKDKAALLSIIAMAEPYTKKSP